MNSSPLRAVIQSDVDEALMYLKREVIEPWMFFNSHGVDIPKANGKRIGISGVTYSGSAVDVFWGQFADEWLQKKGKELIESTRLKAIERGLPVGPAISICLGYIDGMIQTICHRMADVDQSLRGNGNPRSVHRRDVSSKIEKNRRKISEYAESEIESYKTSHQTNISPVVNKKNAKTRWWDSLELKPNFFGMGLNLNHMLDRFVKPKNKGSKQSDRDNG